MYSAHRYLPKEEKKRCINTLSPLLNELRIRANISITDLSCILGMTRQAYSPIEHNKITMKWQTYIALIWFYDNNPLTHKMLRNSPAFPESVFERVRNGRRTGFDRLGVTGEELSCILDELDDRALDTLKVTLAAEYTRCMKDLYQAENETAGPIQEPAE